MPFLPPSALRIGDIFDIDDGEVLICAERDGTVLLKIGGHAVFLTGEWTGSAFAPERAGDWMGPVITGLEFQIDIASYAQDRPDSPLAILRTGTALLLRSKTQPRGGFRDHQMVTMVDNLEPCSESRSGWFTRWRLVRHDGDGFVEFFDSADGWSE